ncbi:hypothetical protein GDO86_001768 [Hymenochirus boettgeri]|uniref:Uncharacterized protein n=1 Tax=Hymenochirus boettgeri TaxID=247094 RepID=A0A8T2KF25_9PIPI|nr:hypothetical protein GDO86_001768 [Hymenochirus boettgeri]
MNLAGKSIIHVWQENKIYLFFFLARQHPEKLQICNIINIPEFQWLYRSGQTGETSPIFYMHSSGRTAMDGTITCLETFRTE